MNAVPLRGNRDFVLLQTGNLLLGHGNAGEALAYPLLVPALTHSPAKAGAVGAVRIIPFAAFALLAEPVVNASRAAPRRTAAPASEAEEVGSHRFWA